MNLLSIDVPPTYYPDARITIVGEKPGADEVNWHVCPRCGQGSAAAYCSHCSIGTRLKPEGFVGKSGNSLAQMVRGAGGFKYNKSNVVKCKDGGFTSEEFKRTFYETAVVAVQTPTGKTSSKTKRVVRPTAALEVWIDRLRQELIDHPVNVVVAAGNEALYALTGLTGIEHYRGSVLESTLVPGLKVVPIIHPAAMWHGRRWEYYYVGITDLKRAAKESSSGGFGPVDYVSCIDPQWTDVVEFFAMAMSSDQRWCLDLETRSGFVACLGLSCGKHKDDIRTICIPIQLTTGPRWTPAEEAQIWKFLALLMRRNPNLVGQNLFGFDLDILLDYGCEPCGVYMDTMSAFALCYPEYPKKLDFINSLFGRLPYYKMDSKTWGSSIPNEQLHRYNTMDTFSTLEISWQCEEDLRQAGLWDLYVNYCLPVHWMALEMQKRRIDVSVEMRENTKVLLLDELQRVRRARMTMLERYRDGLVMKRKRKAVVIDAVKDKATKQWTATAVEFPDVVATAAKKVDAVREVKRQALALSPTEEMEITPENFNPESPQHMQALVFNAMGLPLRHKKGSQALTTDEDALMDLIAYYPEKTADLKLLMLEKHLNKAMDYVEYNLTLDNKLAFSISFPGTKSFRFSMSTNPQGYGFNAQTPPRWSRSQYVPPPGRVFISRDLAQVEARVVAALANCKLQLEKFKDPSWSIHKDLGKEIYGEVPAKDTPRYVAAKGGIHGGNFREGPLKLARSTGAPLRDTKLALEGYHRKYPEIKQWHEETRREVIQAGKLVNPFGFRRVFYKACGHLALQGMIDESEWNEACNAIPQSVPPFIINQAIIKAMERWEWIWFHHQGHDSYLASVPVGRAVEGDKYLREALDIPIYFDSGELRVPSEAQIGWTWGEMMPLGEVEPTWEEWEAWVEAEAAAGRGRSREALMLGVSGIL